MQVPQVLQNSGLGILGNGRERRLFSIEVLGTGREGSLRGVHGRWFGLGLGLITGWRLWRAYVGVSRDQRNV